MLLGHSLLEKMLCDDAQATSSCWVSMFLSRNPDVLPLFSGAAPSDRVAHLLNEASQVGDIYRFCLWSTTGHLLFNSERLPAAEVPAFPIQYKGRFARPGAMWSVVHAGSPPHDVPYFVESFIPVERNGTVVGFFDVYLDQSDDKLLYERSIQLTEGIIAALVLLAGCIPGILYYRQMLQQRAAKAEALFLAAHDSLTGIPNRKQLAETAKATLAASRRNGSYVAALMIDLDRFKEINDTFGHRAGDEVLKIVAVRLLSAIREEDGLARFGGDEFAVLQGGMTQPGGASTLADRLMATLSEPYNVDGAELACGASIGVAISPPDAQDFEGLLACADIALYKSKARGRNSVTFFEPGMDAAVRERRQLEIDIRRAIATNSFQLAYQPFHSFHDGSLLGFEALLRWPQGWNPQPPSVFIPIAEESGLIHQLGAWVLETACKTAAGWANPLRIAVNLSPIQFRRGDIVSVVEKAIKDSGLVPNRLELEVTESLWIQNTDAVHDQLSRLRRLDVSIVLDDFGTGYSSLTYLWKFPFDAIKIDRSFVSGIESEPKAAAIVNTVVVLGKALDLTVTAEGVETPLQAQVLRDAGCNQAQGFLYGRPLTAASANALANGGVSYLQTHPR